MTRVESGVPEYAALIAAFADDTPACAGDDRFVLDRENQTRSDIDAMRSRCDACPVYALCDAYAAAAKPKGGFWAGEYGARSYKRRARAEQATRGAETS